jgi:hypothetical protein
MQKTMLQTASHRINIYAKRAIYMSNLLLKFKSKDSPYGVTRETLKALADELDISETMVVHLALSRFAKEVLPAYEADDGQLTAGNIAHIRKLAERKLPERQSSEHTIFTIKREHVGLPSLRDIIWCQLPRSGLLEFLKTI